MNFELNQILTVENDTLPIGLAKFCNENGYYIAEIGHENGISKVQICAPKKKTLDELKASKLSELTAITSKFDDRLVNTDMIIKSSLGFSINADLRSQNNLRGLIAVGIEPVNFMTADNSVKSLSLEQLNVLLKETIKNGENLYKTKWMLRDKILNSSSVEELEAIELKFTMKDFS